MVEYKQNGHPTMVLTFEPEDSLEMIASRMACDVYELVRLMNKLSDGCWSGEPIDWSDDDDD